MLKAESQELLEKFFLKYYKGYQVRLESVIRIMGLDTLDALDYIPVKSNVKFLSSQTSESTVKLNGAISDFKREHPNSEFRLFPDPKTLHDRYILSGDSLLLLGHGIKDIGNEKSFIIGISADYAEDVIKGIKEAFDERWKRSSPI